MGALITIAKFALAILQAFGWINNLAERRAGAAQSQLEAINAEIKRVQDAAIAGTTIDGVRGQQVDTNDLDQ